QAFYKQFMNIYLIKNSLKSLYLKIKNILKKKDLIKKKKMPLNRRKVLNNYLTVEELSIWHLKNLNR
ncbi:MAG TPA: hypothetical protein PKD90_05425, partial [Phnomibacter sp.]|nr:hypothetical protein [Phnomibacter sp.]